MHIVFLGNCQVGTLAQILRDFVAPYVEMTTDFIDAYQGVNETSVTRLGRADMVVAQASAKPPLLDHSHIPPGVPVHRVPIASGAFIWPYHDVAHPLNPVSQYGNPPYMPEYNDRYLVKLLRDQVSPREALAQYKAFDVAAAAHVGRLYELTTETQRALDAECGYDCAGIIAEYLPSEQLFQSAYHFSGRIGRHLAATLCERMGFGTKYAQRIDAHLKDSPFVPRFVPVHPSVARYFGMTWVQDDTRYPFLWEGAFTFDEYVLRFMEARWSAALQEGIIDARRDEPGARAKLEQGLKEAPFSAEGWHELARIMERSGDLAQALVHQQRAVRLEPAARGLFRFGDLLRKNGEHDRAARMFRRATEADPMSLPAWTALRDTLMQLGRMRRAKLAAEQVVALAPHPAAATRVLSRIEDALQ